MSSDGVRRLADVRMADVAAVGGKAAGLGELLALNANVPDGVVLTLDWAAAPPDARAEAVARALAELGDGPFAVRSSGISEDGSEHSFAGMFATFLEVPAGGVAAAAERCLESAADARATAYASGATQPMAIIVQRMVAPAAAGVALTADPISGDRSTCVVTAVRGLGERLVAGEALGDEWVVNGMKATPRRQPERSIDARQARTVADEARRIADARGAPQDVEWVIDQAGDLWIVQARPMTALPPEVSWEPPAPGAYHRALRLGEWIGEPVTPLFESWLLSDLEVGLHAFIRRELGQRAPLPHHVIVNGWYFYSLNWIAPGNMLRSLPSILWHLVRDPRSVGGVLPATVRHSFPIMERRWRRDVQPRYRAAVADAEAR
ncbi:MAG TPA: PEP/pyruvate-binding domain-containing protein, partial [Candidatus Limnocylindria bacterium]|nr:PEP/pyruvate-binding domain-containing protein [Candidatus Limnocylindria bacterium]